MANEKVEAVIRRAIEARASAIVDQYAELIRDELRKAIGDVVATVATTETIQGAELVVRVRVGK